MRSLPSALLLAAVALALPTPGSAQDVGAAETEPQAVGEDDVATAGTSADEPAEATPAEGDITRDGPTPAAEAEQTSATPSEAPGREASQPSQHAEAPKVAVVVIGDPDDRLRGFARAVDRALGPRLRRPFDPGLRGALRGEPGESDDGLREIRRDRRRLNGGEAHDARLLAALGRRAGAVAVAVVRQSGDGPELLVLDVRHAAFFEGALPLSLATDSTRISGFVGRRALATARVQAITPEAAATEVEGPDLQPDPADEEDEPDFLEQFWPYFVAALLLGGMVAIIAGTAASSQADQPVLRFVPGG